ncbi:hypothetical protein M409DRAFT_23725 [Zasmidium cellare ATCC 36951]|uniref:tRNA wybutosine-synthesizing protein 2 n=1 Tax=Zasmidium cellare ATCC 36951 TaxID=1080233 RepID=A0A6A6CIJ0_ZASCE|nr:uncharacterized protein M409DRAFT_23725 [Zasmidium cellare ATCC 36951]KAF2165998.1 hypothetical protein M409DRAFT_23725 [Zasmidium cellare ATCC 36951]
MDRAVRLWLSKSDAPPETCTALTKKLNKSYTIYGTMLLLPPTALSGPEWTQLQPKIDNGSLAITNLYKEICHHLKITHIALNKPIPLHLEEETEPEENILRSPTNFTPLHGDFGPVTASSPPTSSDFDRAYWVTAKQNGIYQTWSPRWTMFSRGNISEKARLLTLPSVLQAVEEGDCTAVDLYVGIGYFAFSYKKAGVKCVLGWDLNPWSCEGLRRGAGRNGWGVGVVGEGEEVGGVEELVVFNESNVHAPRRVEGLRGKGLVPPVRHVNCGMLPSSRESLELAASVLHESVVGWVHVHENFLVEEIEGKAEETRREFEGVVKTKRGGNVKTEVEYINRLKSYAPGVVHCVIDIVVHPTDPT